MNTRVRWLVSLVVCGCVLGARLGTAEAQFPDLVDVSGQYLPEVALRDPKPARAQVASYDATLNAPVPLGPRTFLIPGMSYHVDAVSFSHTPPDFTELRAFHGLEASLLFVQLLPRDNALSLRLAPGLAGDFEAFDLGLLRMNALALITHAFSSSFVLGGGGLASYSFGSLLPLPALYTEWKPTRDTSLEAFVPAFVAIKHTFAQRFEVGARADVAGNAYAIRDPRIADSYPCAAEDVDKADTPADETRADRSQCMDHVAYSVGAAGVTASVRLFASVWIGAFMGRTLFRRLEQQNEAGKRIAGGLQSLPNPAVFRAHLTWRIPRDD